MSYVFVLDTKKQALNPVHPGRARILLSTGKAAVFKRYPFTIVLTCEVSHPLLAKKPELLKKIQAQAKAPLKDAMAVNATRWKLFHRLEALGLPVECGSGGLTKFHRVTKDLPKRHWIDAACVGKSTPECLQVKVVVPLLITATGSGNRQMCGVDKHGFPYRHRQRKKVHSGYQTGDMIRAVVPAGLKTQGTHSGRVLARATGSFDIQTAHGRVAGVGYRYCRPIHRNDGYAYVYKKSRLLPPRV
jgi:hypothetical protein